MKTSPPDSKPGQSLVEYALIAALVIVAAILILSLTGNSVSGIFCSVVTALNRGDAGSCSVYLSDSFGNMNSWQNVYGNSNWKLVNGKLEMVSGDQRLLNKTKMPSADYRLTVNSAQLLAGPGFGLLFRQSPSGTSYSGYSFQVDPGLGNRFVFRRYDLNGVESGALAMANFPANFNASDPHKVEVLVKGSTYQAFVDGSLVLTATDGTYLNGGQVGLRTWYGSDATFGSLVVTPP